ncbi:hypothetical protein L210DRAFT_3501056 [Boletus edulis BED1]|uniref:Uncharacterized protein n=1 Tax=Boletus edulis BED1 TaxID=1328754 RepID=A0AAD4C3L1_BOLED|nr:hypothetical protein L210DRAFT_3501056 [Boletus edulis BED1]
MVAHRSPTSGLNSCIDYAVVHSRMGIPSCAILGALEPCADVDVGLVKVPFLPGKGKGDVNAMMGFVHLADPAFRLFCVDAREWSNNPAGLIYHIVGLIAAGRGLSFTTDILRTAIAGVYKPNVIKATIANAPLNWLVETMYRARASPKQSTCGTPSGLVPLVVDHRVGQHCEARVEIRVINGVQVGAQLGSQDICSMNDIPRFNVQDQTVPRAATHWHLRTRWSMNLKRIPTHRRARPRNKHVTLKLNDTMRTLTTQRWTIIDNGEEFLGKVVMESDTVDERWDRESCNTNGHCAPPKAG